MKRPLGHRRPSAIIQNLILSAQGNKCFYCGLEFILEPPQFDHFNPYSYSFDSSVENFVAACKTCNMIKSSKVFDTRDQAINYIQDQRILRGMVFSLCKQCGKEFRMKRLNHEVCSVKCGVRFKRQALKDDKAAYQEN